MSAVDTNEADSWIVDLSVTCHICNDRQSFVEFQPLKKPQNFMPGDGHALSTNGASIMVPQSLCWEMEKSVSGDCMMYSTYQIGIQLAECIEESQIPLRQLSCFGLRRHNCCCSVKKEDLYYLSC